MTQRHDSDVGPVVGVGLVGSHTLLSRSTVGDVVVLGRRDSLASALRTGVIGTPRVSPVPPVKGLPTPTILRVRVKGPGTHGGCLCGTDSDFK